MVVFRFIGRDGIGGVLEDQLDVPGSIVTHAKEMLQKEGLKRLCIVGACKK